MKDVKKDILEDSYNSIFASRLRLTLDSVNRDGEKLTQEKLAKKIGVTRQAVGQWKDGLTTPNIGPLKKIGEEYNISIDWLLGLSDTKHLEDSDIPKKTGLTPQAVETLIKWMNYHATYHNSRSVINTLIEKGSVELFDALYLYWVCEYDNFIANPTKQANNLSKGTKALYNPKTLEDVGVIYHDGITQSIRCVSLSDFRDFLFAKMQSESIKFKEQLSKEREEVENNGKE